MKTSLLIIIVSAIIASSIVFVAIWYSIPEECNEECEIKPRSILAGISGLGTIDPFKRPSEIKPSYDPYVVEIPFDQTIRYENLELYFYDTEDSRCPMDVTCIWEGQVTAMIHVKNQTHKISGYFTPNHTMNYISPYNITLVDIRPYPVSTEKPNYVVTLEIKKLE
ncbi:hypothetical protein [Nitrosopumilus adriaticus]|uniref:Uncharacterized protein n=1 Tax=Nitrosopumilus adriaticus TaxID=1580092 RepID=A0A0D5C1N4_9ARCH|nr:hypothetical protein [Nitrosopumilus adriaticus]AJW70245.1 exported protein of unknown function [Nitrosopumilus adriaticus]